ncbi:hypothetical protein H1C71_007812 [Ictidomys tridecemlineatus]|nr:hypothetical protein H1C71_007812 [Ictidomys tridecemlineatus]
MVQKTHVTQLVPSCPGHASAVQLTSPGLTAGRLAWSLSCYPHLPHPAGAVWGPQATCPPQEPQGAGPVQASLCPARLPGAGPGGWEYWGGSPTAPRSLEVLPGTHAHPWPPPFSCSPHPFAGVRLGGLEPQGGAGGVRALPRSPRGFLWPEGPSQHLGVLGVATPPVTGDQGGPVEAGL